MAKHPDFLHWIFLNRTINIFFRYGIIAFHHHTENQKLLMAITSRSVQKISWNPKLEFEIENTLICRTYLTLNSFKTFSEKNNLLSFTCIFQCSMGFDPTQRRELWFLCNSVISCPGISKQMLSLSSFNFARNAPWKKYQSFWFLHKINS